MRGKNRLLALLLLVVLLFGSAAFSQPANADNPDPTPYTNPYMTISCTYPMDNSYRRDDFIYSDDMLLGDAHAFSTDLAKASAALMAAVYGKSISNIQGVLSQMGFSVVGGSSSYVSRSIDDCDHVAYAIGQKIITDADGTQYMAYCVPIRGSYGAEWFSNFLNLGNGSNYHEGFYKAAKEIYDTLCRIMGGDNFNGPRIIWIAGHSRAAAVGNIVEGLLTKASTYATPDHIFGYNFACPYALKSADTSYSNIHNINNLSDPVPRFPLASWGYRRNGSTNTMDFYTPGTTPQAISSVMNMLTVFVPDEDAYHEPEKQLALVMAAYFMGGNEEVTLAQVQNYCKTIEAKLVAKGLLKKAAEKLITSAMNIVVPGSSSVAKGIQAIINVNKVIKELLEEEYGNYSEWVQFLSESMDAIQNMTDEEYQQYYQNNRATFQAITEMTGITIESYDDMHYAQLALNDGIEAGSRLIDDAAYIYNNFSEIASVGNGHIQSTYIAGINSAYYGYQGYRGSGIKTRSLPTSCTTIGPECFANCQSMTDIEIPSSVVHIGNQAFSSCPSLMGVTIPEGTCSIGNQAFEGCTGAETLLLPDTLKIIGNSAFSGCSGIASLIIPDSVTSIGASAFQNCSGLKELTLPAEYSQSSIFTGCTAIETVRFTKGITGIMPDGNGIGYVAKKSLQSVDIGEGVQNIVANAFSGCTNLSEVELSEGITCIGDSAFAYCKGLKDLVVPDSVTTYGTSWIERCTGLESLTLGAGADSYLKKDGRETSILFIGRDSTLKRLHLNEGITELGDYTFANYKYDDKVYFYFSSLETVELPTTLTRIGDYTFSGSSIQSISIPVNVQSIGQYAFYQLKGITEITLNMTECTVGNYAFSGCSNLENVKIGEGIKSIGIGAFSSCVKLSEVELSEGITCIGDSAFAYCKGLKDLVVPDSVITYGTSWIERYTGLESLTLGAGADSYLKKDGRETSILFIGRDSTLKRLHLNEGITELGDYTFANYKYDDKVYFYFPSLETVELPTTLTSIGDYAFKRTGIHRFVLPNGISSISSQAFSGIANLTMITFAYNEYVANYAVQHGFVYRDSFIQDQFVSTQTLTMQAGQRLQIVSRLVPIEELPKAYYGSLSLHWKSDDPAIASIDENGMISAQAEGSTIVRVYCPNDERASVEITVSVASAESTNRLALPAALTAIESEAFAGIGPVNILALPAGVSGIGSRAFADNTSLWQVILPTLSAEIAQDALENTNAVFVLPAEPEAFSFPYVIQP